MPSSAGEHASHATPGAHQPADERLSLIWAAGCGLAALTLLGLAIAALVIRAFGGEVGAAPHLARTEDIASFATPRLQATLHAELDTLRREQQRTLAGYSWVDRERGIARIPIERAKELLLEHGIAVFTRLPQQGTAEEDK